MSYDYLIRLRVSQAMAADLKSLAERRETDLCKLLRRAALRELAEGPDPDSNLREQMLFTAIALDGLLAANPDTGLRARIIKIWQDRLAGETNHVA